MLSSGVVNRRGGSKRRGSSARNSRKRGMTALESWIASFVLSCKKLSLSCSVSSLDKGIEEEFAALLKKFEFSHTYHITDKMFCYAKWTMQELANDIYHRPFEYGLSFMKPICEKIAQIQIKVSSDVFNVEHYNGKAFAERLQRSVEMSSLGVVKNIDYKEPGLTSYVYTAYKSHFQGCCQRLHDLSLRKVSVIDAILVRNRTVAKGFHDSFKPCNLKASNLIVSFSFALDFLAKSTRDVDKCRKWSCWDDSRFDVNQPTIQVSDIESKFRQAFFIIRALELYARYIDLIGNDYGKLAYLVRICPYGDSGRYKDQIFNYYAKEFECLLDSETMLQSDVKKQKMNAMAYYLGDAYIDGLIESAIALNNRNLCNPLLSDRSAATSLRALQRYDGHPSGFTLFSNTSIVDGGVSHGSAATASFAVPYL